MLSSMIGTPLELKPAKQKNKRKHFEEKVQLLVRLIFKTQNTYYHFSSNNMLWYSSFIYII